jgi:hypothetical protein
MSRLTGLACLVICLPLLVVTSNAENSTGPLGHQQVTYTIKSSVIGCAGSRGSDSQFHTIGTLGQATPIGMGTDGTLNLCAGFWGAYQRTAWLVDVLTPEPLRDFVLPNYPNPFNPLTTITYSVALESPVAITVFNLRGQRVRLLVSEYALPGWYTTRWKGEDEHGHQVASGAYFLHVQIGDYQSVRKMLMVK